MSRRCKPGMRARIVNDCSNRGKIVLVVRPYFYPEEVEGARWPEEVLRPWVVTSVSGPLRSYYTETNNECPPSLTIVVDDEDLQPLDDDDDGLPERIETERPRDAVT
jgi:hypothetical protein